MERKGLLGHVALQTCQWAIQAEMSEPGDGMVGESSIVELGVIGLGMILKISQIL